MFYYVLDQHYPGAQKYGDFMKIVGMKSQKLVFVQNFHFSMLDLFFASTLKFFSSNNNNVWEKMPKNRAELAKKGKILKFWPRCLPKKYSFWHIFLDFTLFHQFLAILVLNIVNFSYFALIKMRRNSGEPKKIMFLAGQMNHLRGTKIQGFTGWKCAEAHLMHWKAQNNPKAIHRSELHQHKAFWLTWGPLRHQ